MQRLGDAQERVRHAAGGIGKWRLRAAAGLEVGHQIDQHRLLAPIGELLAHHLDRFVAPALAGQHACVGLDDAHGAGPAAGMASASAGAASSRRPLRSSIIAS